MEKDEVVDAFRKSNFELLIETKMMRKEKFSSCGVNVIYAGVKEH